MRYLIDKSAIEQARRNPQARKTLMDLSGGNQLAMSATVALELLYSARDLQEYESARLSLHEYPWLETNEDAAQNALDIQHRLAAVGHHRMPISDLMIAATAMTHGAMVLHYDKHFDLIAEVTDEETRWIVPRGSGS